MRKLQALKKFLNKHTKGERKKTKVQEKKVEVSAQRYLANPKAVSELEIISSRMHNSDIFFPLKPTKKHEIFHKKNEV